MNEWRAITDYGGLYEVSDRGDVRSLDRVVARNGGRGTLVHRRGRVLKPKFSKRGYRIVSLSRDGRHRDCRIARLVLEAFVGPCPPGQEACHGPGGSGDDRWPENLEWNTRDKNNGPDKDRDGTMPFGTRHPNARLTEEAVREIRRRYPAGGVSQRELAAEFGVSKRAISFVISGKTWRHVQPE